METRIPHPASSGKPQSDTLTAVFSLLCALSRFYAHNRHLPCGNTPRLLLNRIASEVELELESSGIREKYAADLIHIEEELNIGIRSRVPGKNLVAVTFAPGPAEIGTAAGNLRNGSGSLPGGNRNRSEPEKLSGRLACAGRIGSMPNGRIFSPMGGLGAVSPQSSGTRISLKFCRRNSPHVLEKV